MEKSNKRGKIPQSDWPTIMARYEAGETLASIAKTYDCSPPAISYIISRSRARNAGAPAALPATEPQLVKSHAHAAHEAGAAPTNSPVNAPASPPVNVGDSPQLRHHDSTASPAGAPVNDARPNGFGGHNGSQSSTENREPGFPGLPPRVPLSPPAATAQHGEPNQSAEPRIVHLGHGNGGSHQPNGSSNNHPPQPHDTGAGSIVRGPFGEQRGGATGDRQIDHSPQPQQREGGPYRAQPSTQPPRPYDQPRYGYGHPPAQHRPTNGDAPSKDASASYIDKELRARVDGDIAAFLSAFDAALALDSQDSRSALREATDRLLRAGARTRIELERLEARVPLPPRDTARGAPAFPPR